MKPKHTPGPWHIDEDCWIRSETTAHVVLIPDSYSMPDLRLISKAPEMLHELKFLVDHCVESKTLEYADGTEYEQEYIRDYGDCLERIRKLLAEIEGES